MSGTFLRGVLDKVGVEPQVKRIGVYKSAGDQLLRKDMSEAQAEQLGAILSDIYEEFLTTVSAARGKTREVSMMMPTVSSCNNLVSEACILPLDYAGSGRSAGGGLL